MSSPRSSFATIAVAIAALAVLSPVALVRARVADPASEGQWSQVYAWPDVPIHMSVLPNGKILMWNGWYSTDPATPTTTWIIDPVLDPGGSSAVSAVTSGHIFCSAHSFMPDGRLLVAGGGHAQSDFQVLTRLFDYRTNSWSPGPAMNDGRWYGTVSTLANGDMLILAGENSISYPNKLPQVFTSVETLRPLSNAQRIVPGAGPGNSDGTDWDRWFPWAFQAPNGSVFVAGSSRGLNPPNIVTGNVDAVGLGTWSQLALHINGLGFYGSAVMFEPGKVLTLGSGNGTGSCSVTSASPIAEVIDLNTPTPAWSQTSSMAAAREYQNAVLLPDGTVLIVGGVNPSGPALAAELWNPSNGQWVTLASMSKIRAYHSTAVLLPDGRVVSGGTLAECVEQNVQYFSPPYLFRGPRPQITQAPENIFYGQPFNLSTTASGSVKVTVVRLPSTTHAFDENQRFINLGFTQNGGAVTVTPPADGAVAPPGHYMLFVLQNGVPSVASIVRLLPGGDSNQPGPSNWDPRCEASPGGFTDEPLVANVTTVKAAHINQLRSKINCARTAYGLPAFNGWQDIINSGVAIKASHIIELRQELDDIYQTIGLQHAPYTDPGLATGAAAKAIHIQEIRNLLRSLL